MSRAAELAVDHVARVIGRHELDGLRADETSAVQLAPIQHHLRKLQVVVGSAHQTAAAGEVRRVQRLVLRAPL